MKNKLKLILGVSLLAIFGCNETKKEETKEKEVVKSVVVTMKMIVPENDGFQLYWDETGNDAIKPNDFVNVDVKGSPNAQEIVFKLPEDVLPTQLRFDIGSNKAQKNMSVLSFKIEYLNKKFEVNKASDFWLYWGHNTSINFTKETGSIKLITDLPEGYDPIFGGTPGLKIELEKLIK